MKVMDFLEKYATQIIALLALILTVYEISTKRRHDRLSVKPHLTLFSEKLTDLNNKKGTYVVNLFNNGIGPSEIIDFKILINNEQTKVKSSDDVTKVIKDLLKDVVLLKDSVSYLQKGYVFSANQKIDLLNIIFSIDSKDHFKEILDRFEKVNLVIKYKSLYNQKFVYDSRKYRNI